MSTISINISAESVAWYGAIVATLSATIGFYNVWRDRANIRVSHQKGMKLINPLPPFSEDKDYLVITVRNKGRRPINLGVTALVCVSGDSLLLADSLSYTTNNRVLTEEKPEGKIIADQEDINFSEILYIQVFDKAGREYRQYLCYFPTFRRWWYKIKNYGKQK